MSDGPLLYGVPDSNTVRLDCPPKSAAPKKTVSTYIEFGKSEFEAHNEV